MLNATLRLLITLIILPGQLLAAPQPSRKALATHLGQHVGSAMFFAQVKGEVSGVYVVSTEDHWTYVTSRRQAANREFVLRVFKAGKVAPHWPIRVLAEMVAVEGRTGRPFKNRDFIRGVAVPNFKLPYAHFHFTQPDGAVPALTAGSGVTQFVRVVPVTDAEQASIDASGKLGVLAEWWRQDHLQRVPRKPLP